MKIIEQAICFAAWQLPACCFGNYLCFCPAGGVPLDFGVVPGDLLFAYGFQYQATPPPRRGNQRRVLAYRMRHSYKLCPQVDRSG